MKTINTRTTEYETNDLFLKRYSPRAMSGEAITKEEIMTLFDAAHWAPSAGNNQSWRFLYALSGTPDFDLFLSFLNEGNQLWCKRGGAIVIGLSKNIKDDGKPNPTHYFELGAAYENMALQGIDMNILVHCMAGYNSESIVKELNIKSEFEVGIMVVVGRHGNIEDLPEYQRPREVPSQRKSITEIAFEGRDGAQLLK